MRGKPKIATKQDLYNVCDMVKAADAVRYVRDHSDLLQPKERQKLLRRLGAGKRAEALAESEAKRRWARLHELERFISALDQENEDLMSCIRFVQAELRDLRAERQELQKTK